MTVEYVCLYLIRQHQKINVWSIVCDPGLMVRRTIGFSDYWFFGPMVRRNIGMSPSKQTPVASFEPIPNNSLYYYGISI